MHCPMRNPVLPILCLIPEVEPRLACRETALGRDLNQSCHLQFRVLSRRGCGGAGSASNGLKRPVFAPHHLGICE